jgi:hypothetical membrane protein
MRGGELQRGPGIRPALGGWVGLIGVLGFAAIVLVLPRLQPAYDARRQLLSELAHGPHGWLMLPAFGCLAMSLLGVQFGLGAVGASVLPRALLVAAAVGMLAAGVFPLASAPEVHIAAVLLAFCLIALTVGALPSRAGCLPTRGLWGASVLLVGGATVAIASGSYSVPIGIAQRLAAACVLGWLCWLSWRLVRSHLYRRPTVTDP